MTRSAGRRPKLLFFTASLGGGGAEMHLLRLLNHLARDRFEPVLALARGGGSFEAQLASDVPVTRFAGHGLPSTPAMAWALPALRRRLQREAPDLLCSVMGHANVVAAAALRALPARRRPPLVACLQNPQTIVYRDSERRMQRAFGALLPATYRRADRLVALSHDVARDVAAFVPGVAAKTEVIPNAGYDDGVLARAREAPPEPLPAGPLLVSCGRLTRQKGFPYLLEAMAALPRSLGAHLWIVGEGEERGALQRRIEALGLGERVRLLGFRANPYAYMARADVFVLPSLWEGFGNVLVEAMALGAPVLATTGPGGPKEIVRDGVDGLLVPPADAAALAGALQRLLCDPALRARLADEARCRARRYHARAVAEVYAGTFLRVLDERRRAEG